MHRGSRITLASDPDKSRHGGSSYNLSYLINNFLTVGPIKFHLFRSNHKGCKIAQVRKKFSSFNQKGLLGQARLRFQLNAIFDS